MERDLTSGFQAQIASSSLRPVLFYEGEFANGTVRLWTGVGTVNWNGHDWVGGASALAISNIQETTEIRASGVKVTLNGLDGAFVSLALAQAHTGKAGRIWLGMIDANGAVIADPYLSFEGRLDVPDITDSGDTCNVSVSYESRLIALERANESRITHEDQQREFPGDRGREYVVELQDKVLAW